MTTAHHRGWPPLRSPPLPSLHNLSRTHHRRRPRIESGAPVLLGSFVGSNRSGAPLARVVVLPPKRRHWPQRNERGVRCKSLERPTSTRSLARCCHPPPNMPNPQAPWRRLGDGSRPCSRGPVGSTEAVLHRSQPSDRIVRSRVPKRRPPRCRCVLSDRATTTPGRVLFGTLHRTVRHSTRHTMRGTSRSPTPRRFQRFRCGQPTETYRTRPVYASTTPRLPAVCTGGRRASG